MANYSYICGFEMGHLAEGYAVTGSPTVQSTYKRSGSYALQCNTTTATAFIRLSSVGAGAIARLIFGAVRFYLRVLSLPSGSCYIMESGGVQLYLGSGGNLSLDNTNWSANSLSIDGQFHKLSVSETGGTETIYVDGVSWLTRTRDISAVANTSLGVMSSVTANLIFDDILWCSDDNAGVDLPAGNVILLPAVSDDTDGTWTAGAGGASLFTAVDSIPPIGDATPTDLTQITNVDKTGNQDVSIYCRSYADGGIGESDTINAVMAICCDGEQVATGTKDGGVWISYNPTGLSQTAPGNTFDFGDDVGALGDFPTNWKTHVGPVSPNPGVNKALSTGVGVRKTVTSSRATDVCFVGVYVDYTPVASQIKKVATVAQASIKVLGGQPIAHVKKFCGVSNV